jgi:lipopolysaccharide export system permease protein
LIGGKLDRYVLRRFLSFYGLALLYLVGIFLVVDLMGRLDKFVEAADGLEAAGRSVAGAVLLYYGASLPLIVLQVAPFVTVMGACMAVVDLRRWNELYPMMEAGRSLARILAPVVAASLLITAILVFVHDRIAPRAVEARRRAEQSIEDESGRTVTMVPHVRDSVGNVWSIGRWDPGERTAEAVRVAPFRPLSSRSEYDLLEVARMAYRREAGGTARWIPEGGRLLLPADRPDGPGTSRVLSPGLALPTDLSPSDIDLARESEDVEGLSGARLRRLRDRYPDLHYLTVLLHKRLTYPLANLVLLFVGVPLVLRRPGASIFLSVLAALGVCAAYFVADTVACDFGGRGVLPPGLAAWMATILFGAAGVAMMDAVSGRPPGR